MGTALSLLRARPRFRALWLAIALSYTGSGAALTALTLYVQERQGSGVAVGAVALAFGLPRILGPLTGAIADRVELRRAMVLCDLGQAACFAALAALPPFGPILALAALTTVLQTVYGPARTAAVPALVGEDELLAANATLGIGYNLYIAIGPLAGGLLFALIGASAVMWVNAASFLGSALLTTRLPRLGPTERRAGEGGPEAILASIRAGVRYALGNELTRVLLVSLLFGVAFVAIDEVALVFLVRETLGAGAAAYGIVLASFGAGMIAGSLGILARLHVPASRVYLAGLLLIGLGTLLTGLAPFAAAAGLFQALAGSGNGVIISAEDTIVQRYVPSSAASSACSWRRSRSAPASPRCSAASSSTPPRRAPPSSSPAPAASSSPPSRRRSCAATTSASRPSSAARRLGRSRDGGSRDGDSRDD